MQVSYPLCRRVAFCSVTPRCHPHPSPNHALTVTSRSHPSSDSSDPIYVSRHYDHQSAGTPCFPLIAATSTRWVSAAWIYHRPIPTAILTAPTAPPHTSPASRRQLLGLLQGIMTDGSESDGNPGFGISIRRPKFRVDGIGAPDKSTITINH